MNKVKVLEIGPSNFGKGGLSSIAWNWYVNFNHSKLQVHFLACAKPDNKYINLIEKNEDVFYCIGSKNFLVRQLKKFFITKKIAKSNKYDCIHIHASDAFEAFVYYLSVKKFCDNIIIHSHSTGIVWDSPIKASIKYIFHKICRRLLIGRKIVRLACSDKAGKWMYPEKYEFTIINNGIETSKFIYNNHIRKEKRNELGVENKFVVGHIGKFNYVKNHIFLIDIFNEIHKKNTNAILLLIGEGELENQIKDKVHNLGLDKAIIFYGTTPNANEFYQAMDCFVLPSHFEGMPLVLIEAQAAALKCMCSDTITLEAGITDLLEYMSLSSDPKKWAEKILTYANYDRKDMSNEIKESGFDIKYSAKQLEDIYCS
ncbi:MAG: glycosyltransferase [Lachnospiraceae bacterium]|nr:glycosyltransferase [Lachnospiraceae bacterium]